MAVKQLKDMLQFLKTLRGMKTDDESQETQQRLVDGCMKEFSSRPAISMAEAADMLHEARTADVPEWMKQKIIHQIELKTLSSVATAETSDAKRNCMQRNSHLQAYFTQKDWESLCNEKLSLDSKMQILCDRFASIGLSCASEPTKVLAVAILCYARHEGRPEDLRVDVKTTFAELKDFKVLLSTTVKKTKHSGLKTYPPEPSQLPETIFKTAYNEKQGDPVACPLDARAISNLADDLPMRKTHSKITIQGRSGQFESDVNFKQWLAQSLVEQMIGNHGQGLPAMPKVQLLPRGKKRPAALKDCAHAESEPEGPSEPEKAVEISEDLPAKLPGKKSTKKLALLGVDAMAEQVRKQLEDNKEKKAKSKESADPKKVPKNAKPPASQAPPKKPKSKLAFPGTAKQPAQYIDDLCTIYTCPNSTSWRVKKQGDKKDKSFSWKNTDPKDVWQRVIQYVEELKETS